MITCSNCAAVFPATAAHVVACPACGHETFSPGLRCARCSGVMRADEAMPAPEGARAGLQYHAEFSACVRVALANLAAASPVMRAMFGCEETRG